jgi:predicted ATP-dependent serine protease
MADVACFCGCVYSFEGAAGACPKCGEWATVTGGPVVTGYGQRSQHEAENKVENEPELVVSRTGKAG